MLFAPRGFWGLTSERYDVTMFPIQRRLVVDVADGEASQPKRVRGCRAPKHVDPVASFSQIEWGRLARCQQCSDCD